MKLPNNVIRFLGKQGLVIVSTLDAQGSIHCSAKGIVGIEKEGKVFVIDLYKSRTFKNLKRNLTASITAVDEHNFEGYTLQGIAKIVYREEIQDHIVKEWESQIVKRISTRIIKSIQSEKKTQSHFEAELPSQPKYLIEIDVKNIIDLSPLRKK